MGFLPGPGYRRDMNGSMLSDKQPCGQPMAQQEPKIVLHSPERNVHRGTSMSKFIKSGFSMASTPCMTRMESCQHTAACWKIPGRLTATHSHFLQHHRTALPVASSGYCSRSSKHLHSRCGQALKTSDNQNKFLSEQSSVFLPYSNV